MQDIQANQTDIPLEIVESVVQKAAGFPVTHIERIPKGITNVVFRVETSQMPFIVKFNETSGLFFELEREVKLQAGHKDVPTSFTYDVGKYLHGEQVLSYAVEDVISGQDLETILETKALPKEKLHAYAQQAGEALRKLHSVTGPHFTNNVDRTYEYNSLLEMRLESIAYRRDDWWLQPMLALDFSMEEYTQLIETMKQLFTQFNETQAHLLHGDYQPAHIFFEHDTVTGIIDFGNTSYGSPFQDFIGWEFHNTLPLEWLLEGYGDENITKDPDFQTKYILHQLYERLNTIARSWRKDQAGKFPELMEKIRGDWRYLKDF
jgi:aminoglycoside phosphotransferase (APT) family kinase protein